MAFRTALHSVSYAGVWPGQVRLTLEQFLAKAKTIGFDAVMLMAKRPHLSVLDCDIDARQALRSQVERLGLKVACLAGYTDFGLGADRPDIPAREMQLLYVRELARLARDHPAATYDQQWKGCVSALRECARFAAPFGVTVGVQNHHDCAVHYESLFDLLEEIAEPNCKAVFDAWAPALHGSDLAAGVKLLAPYIVHTTVADYVRRPRFRYQPPLVNYAREPDAVRAVAMGEGFIDYRGFFQSLAELGYDGYVAYEMCSPLRGGGAEENLDRCARQFLKYMSTQSLKK